MYEQACLQVHVCVRGRGYVCTNLQEHVRALVLVSQKENDREETDRETDGKKEKQSRPTRLTITQQTGGHTRSHPHALPS